MNVRRDSYFQCAMSGKVYMNRFLMTRLLLYCLWFYCRLKVMPMGAGVTFCGQGKLGVPPPALLTYLCPGRPCFSSSDVFLFCWAAFLSISLLASVFPVSLPLFFLFLRPCLIHARMPNWGRAFVHGHTFLHSWSGPMIMIVGLLHRATFLSNLTLVFFVSFIHDSTY